ncbi:hypothetical protein ACIP4Y_35155 [Streptomyces sp. NPDC088810]|uniref:hypothetical protein n=1 Tax=Streptomyces sp. NPDC088810 TaxID=3365904 RepID=UPI00381847CA
MRYEADGLAVTVRDNGVGQVPGQVAGAAYAIVAEAVPAQYHAPVEAVQHAPVPADGDAQREQQGPRQRHGAIVAVRSSHSLRHRRTRKAGGTMSQYHPVIAHTTHTSFGAQRSLPA